MGLVNIEQYFSVKLDVPVEVAVRKRFPIEIIVGIDERHKQKADKLLEIVNLGIAEHSGTFIDAEVTGANDVYIKNIIDPPYCNHIYFKKHPELFKDGLVLKGELTAPTMPGEYPIQARVRVEHNTNAPPSYGNSPWAEKYMDSKKIRVV